MAHVETSHPQTSTPAVATADPKPRATDGGPDILPDMERFVALVTPASSDELRAMRSAVV